MMYFLFWYSVKNILMLLKKLLRLQLLYYILGILFNAVSFILIAQGGKALTPNDPLIGSVVMTIYATFLIPGFLKKITISRPPSLLFT